MDNSSSTTIIDNSRNVYIPFHLKCGLTAQCSLDVFEQCPTILDIIEEDAYNCLRVLPSSVHDLVRRTKIWINVSYVYGHCSQPKVLKHMNTHHYVQWLECINDRLDKVLGIEIYNCFEYLENRNHWNGCGLLLHEFCHLIHQLILPQGLHNADVKYMFDHAMRSQLYDEVIRRDWAYLDCDRDAAYATINHKEFFAEISVSFLSRGYQYLEVVRAVNGTRNEIDDNGGGGGDGGDGGDGGVTMDMDILSPPFQAPQVLERQNENQSDIISQNKVISQLHSFIVKVLCHRQYYHCNNFFPFTSRQLECYDPETFEMMSKIWLYISTWQDPIREKSFCATWLSCCSCCCGTEQEPRKEVNEPLLSGLEDIMMNDKNQHIDSDLDGMQDTIVL